MTRITRWLLLLTIVSLLGLTACDPNAGGKKADDAKADTKADATKADDSKADDAKADDTKADGDDKKDGKSADATNGGPSPSPISTARVNGWLHWRGPNQDGVSPETGLPDTVSTDPDDGNLLWSYDIQGRGQPVVVGNRVYSWGYSGEEADLQEQLTCLDADTGQVIWKHRFNDFLSDIIYDRYAIGGPTVDPDTGLIYLLTTPGVLKCFQPDGKLVWQVSMMEDYGRLTFPNGRTGAPVIEGDTVIVNVISTNWGAQGPPRNRFYAFQKTTGDPVWASTPGVGPPFLKDSSFSSPVFDVDAQGRRVFYAGIGSGAVVCVNARTGQPIWRFQMSVGGINSTPLIYRAPNGERHIIAIHGKENLDSNKMGRMVAIKADAEGTPDAQRGGAPVLPREAEVWRNNDLIMFTSSPCLVGDRVYQVVATGELYCIDANTGKTLWHKKLGASQIHASPLYADGKLYVPMNNGTFWILKPGDDDAEELSKVQLEGNCLGAPSIWNGKVYVHTTRRLYCFGTKGDNPGAPKSWPTGPKVKAGQTVSLRAIPQEVLLAPGQKRKVDLQGIDDKGVPTGPVAGAAWAKYIPPTARVRAEMDANFNDAGEIVAAADANPSAGAFRATKDNMHAVIRGRVLTSLPYTEDFESYDINVEHATETGAMFAYPPLAWIGARFKWEVREVDGTKALAKTLDRLILQRAVTFFGPSTMSNYTLQADVKTDGNRRLRSEVGLVNQRYIIVLKGNHRLIEVNSNQERIKVSEKYPFEPNKWYTLKTRVDVNDDGSGVVKAKVWLRDEAEPDEWTIEVPHNVVHKQGAPGMFGFSPQGKHRVYIDNIKATPNGPVASE